jgi:NodT family efflux transporter outer membrane factor (OMF) lipoprotein
VLTRHRWGAAVLAVALAGCEVGPDYVPPHPELPAQWTEAQVTAAQAAATAQQRDWWRSFHDPALDRLVDAAIAGNIDLAIARQRLVSARAARVVAGAGAYPQIGANVQGALANSSTTLQYPPGNGEYRTYALGFDASWELDVFGGIKREEEAADADVQATIEDRRAILVSLLSEVASDYAALRASQARIGIANRNIGVAQQALDLTNTEFARGLMTSLAVAEAKAQVETLQAALPPLRAEVARLTHAIAVAAGQLPGALEAELSSPAPVIPAPPQLPLSLPSEVVANRPDIRRAERRLAAATARVGAAVAQRYPHFTIPLMLEPTSSYLSELFESASLVWSIGLTVSQTIYQGGRLRAREQQARAAAEADALAYRQTVLTGLREVEDALVTYAMDTQRSAALGAAVADDRTAQSHAQRLFAAGLTDFLNVLTTERTLYAAEDQQALSELARVQQVIALYKALGGGWQSVSFADELPGDGAVEPGAGGR